MEVLSQLAWHIVVNDRVDALDIETTGCEVGGHEIIDSAISELL